MDLYSIRGASRYLFLFLHKKQRELTYQINKGSYTSAHVLLNELRKIDKMQGLSSILSLFHTEFNKFNNTGACMLDSIYHMTLKLIAFLA